MRPWLNPKRLAHYKLVEISGINIETSCEVEPTCVEPTCAGRTCA